MDVFMAHTMPVSRYAFVTSESCVCHRTGLREDSSSLVRLLASTRGFTDPCSRVAIASLAAIEEKYQAG